MFGGFVKWEKGELADGSDSRAVQVAPETHWPELEALILVASAEKKETGSTDGMITSVRTSSLLAHRAKEVVPARLAEMEAAYLRRDFEAFGTLTMKDSNQFHATCLDTYPPIFYLNSVSHAVIALVHKYNDFHGRVRAAYTFDAGPNAVVFLQKEDVEGFLALVLLVFPPAEGRTDFVNHGELAECARAAQPPAELLQRLESFRRVPCAVTRVIHTTVGTGPQDLGEGGERALAGLDGLPLGGGDGDNEAGGGQQAAKKARVE
jgi:diphosphomevalonate decarboxylase